MKNKDTGFWLLSFTIGLTDRQKELANVLGCDDIDFLSKEIENLIDMVGAFYEIDYNDIEKGNEYLEAVCKCIDRELDIIEADRILRNQ